MVFITDDMAIRSRREYRLVLIPAYGILLVFLATLPLFALLLALGQRNLAGVFLAVSMLYVAGYEWLHLSFHMPPESFVARLRIVRLLRSTHAIHHDPRLMQRYNFNVTLPLWDMVRGTWVRSREEALARRSA
jgi:sterol desaturase/sphingolipid hydroxylase (fatty acid hydroxylase superfamily)